MPWAEVEGAGRPAGVLVRGDDIGVWATASDALQAARMAADAILVKAEGEREEQRGQGYAEGYEEGAEQAARLIVRATADASARLDQIEAALPELVARSVERILGSFDVQALVLPAVAQAMRQLRWGATATLRAAPGCVEPLRALLVEIGGEAVRLEADPELAEGNCRLSSELGDVELGVEAQLRALREGLTAGWAEGIRS